MGRCICMWRVSNEYQVVVVITECEPGTLDDHWVLHSSGLTLDAAAPPRPFGGPRRRAGTSPSDSESCETKNGYEGWRTGGRRGREG